jgi:hypothetical protein
MFGNPGGYQGGQDDQFSAARAIIENLAALNTSFLRFLGVAGIAGSFTMPAAASLVVPQALVKSTSMVFLQATNAAAATLQGSTESLYISTLSAGVSFTVATGAGTAATGGETFNYLLINLT